MKWILSKSQWALDVQVYSIRLKNFNLAYGFFLLSIIFSITNHYPILVESPKKIPSVVDFLWKWLTSKGRNGKKEFKITFFRKTKLFNFFFQCLILSYSYFKKEFFQTLSQYVILDGLLRMMLTSRIVYKESIH